MAPGVLSGSFYRDATTASSTADATAQDFAELGQQLASVVSPSRQKVAWEVSAGAKGAHGWVAEGGSCGVGWELLIFSLCLGVLRLAA